MTATQKKAKVRLAKYLELHSSTKSLDNMSIAEMSKAAKAPSLSQWLLDTDFTNWWYDTDTVSTTILAYQEMAVNRLVDILESPMEGGRDAVVTSKDVMNAAKTILELGDAFPKSKKEIVFADKKINSMDEEQVAKELEDVKKKLTVAGEA